MFTPGWRNWQTRQLEGLVLRIRGAGSTPVPGNKIDYRLLIIDYLTVVEKQKHLCHLPVYLLFINYHLSIEPLSII